MKKQPAKPESLHHLIDPCTCEATVSFTVYGAQVEIADQIHPDVPADVRTVSREEAREVYRRLVKAGWFNPDAPVRD